MQEHHSAKAPFFLDNAREFNLTVIKRLATKEKGKGTTMKSEGSSYSYNKHGNDISKALRSNIYSMGSPQTQTMDEPQTDITTSPKSRHLHSQAPRN